VAIDIAAIVQFSKLKRNDNLTVLLHRIAL